MHNHPKSSKESIISYITETRHNDASDPSLSFPRVMALAKQSGTNVYEAHQILDSKMSTFIRKYLNVSLLRDSVEQSNHDRYVEGTDAIEQLYAAM
jgi:hypothetical protein